MTKKVVIVSVPYIEVVPPVAPALLSACLNNAGIPSAGIDFSIEYVNEFINKSYWNTWKLFLCSGYVNPSFNYKRPIIDTLKFLRKFCRTVKENHQPTHIGLSIFTAESLNFGYIFAYAIRKFLPDVKIIVGGRGIESECPLEKILHYEKYYKHGLADLIFVGDGETDLISCINNDVNGIYKARQQTNEDLDNIPTPNWSYYRFELYENLKNTPLVGDVSKKFSNSRSMVMTSSKGCVRKCSFCDVQHFWPKYIYRNGENVARDIIETYRSTGITQFEFTDNLINGSIPNYRAMNQLLAKTIPNTIQYSGYAIFRDKQSSPSEDFEIARLAGCTRWVIGVESGSESVRKDMRKNFTNDDMNHSIVNLHKNNISQDWLLIVGYPAEHEDDFQQTLELIKRYKEYNKNNMIRVSVTLPFQLNNYVPLTQEEKFVNKYQWEKDESMGNLYRYFWVSPANTENTFQVRYDRWVKLTKEIQDCSYSFAAGFDFQKSKSEISNLKKLYDEHNKKIIIISKSA